jgi:hypothetical protein
MACGNHYGSVLAGKGEIGNRKPTSTASHYKRNGAFRSFKEFTDLNPNNAQQNPKITNKIRIAWQKNSRMNLNPTANTA